jgi:hypothetical protein
VDADVNAIVVVLEHDFQPCETLRIRAGNRQVAERCIAPPLMAQSRAGRGVTRRLPSRRIERCRYRNMLERMPGETP